MHAWLGIRSCHLSLKYLHRYFVYHHCSANFFYIWKYLNRYAFWNVFSTIRPVHVNVILRRHVHHFLATTSLKSPSVRVICERLPRKISGTISSNEDVLLAWIVTWWRANSIIRVILLDTDAIVILFVKLEELHIATARKPLFHQTQPVACYQHRNQLCML